MGKDSTIPLQDIIESCERIIHNVEKVTLKQFQTDINLQDAVIRRFEIIGEAVKKIPEEVRLRYPDIQWRSAAGFRDVLIHDYPEVVIDVVYTTGKEHLPTFRDQIKKVLSDISA